MEPTPWLTPSLSPSTPLGWIALLPLLLMAVSALWPPARGAGTWRRTQGLCAAALLAALGALALQLLAVAPLIATDWLRSGPLVAVMAVLVQALGWVIAAFSARYLYGEPGQARYQRALVSVLGAVQLLLLADHWALLIAAWALVGVAMQT
ncbi:MAG: NADH-quinone oxidoreductase subunit L, partial [Inhella sp.]